MFLQFTFILIPIVLLALAVGAVRRIPEGQVYSLYRFGRPARMLDAGVHVVWPVLDRVAHKISLTGKVSQLEPRNDDAPAGKVYWQVLEPDRADAVIDEAETLLRRAATDALAAGSPADEPPARALRLKTALNEQLRSRGILVTRVELD